MLFSVEWEFTHTSEERQKRTLSMFSQWQPPEGADFQGWYGYADGRGGVAIVDVDSEATLQRTIGPWAPFMRFTPRPILPIQESVAIAGEAVAFRESVS